MYLQLSLLLAKPPPKKNHTTPAKNNISYWSVPKIKLSVCVLYTLKYYPYLATGASFEKQSEKPIGISHSFGKTKNNVSFSACTRTPWRPSKIPPLSLHTLSITIRLPMSSTLLAISWAMDGVRGWLFNPSHRRLPCAFIGYSGLALRWACEELGYPQRWCALAAMLQPPPYSP